MSPRCQIIRFPLLAGNDSIRAKQRALSGFSFVKCRGGALLLCRAIISIQICIIARSVPNSEKVNSLMTEMCPFYARSVEEG